MNNHEQLLVAYSEELGVSINIEQLISSHRVLRAAAMRAGSETLQDRETSRLQAYSDAKYYANTHKWFSKERLKSLTVAELVQLLDN